VRFSPDDSVGGLNRDAALATIAVVSNSTNAMYAQLLNQYAPQPPFDAGTPMTAPPEILGSFSRIFGGGTAEVEEVVTAFLQDQETV
jgi:cyclohexyl-isocyanide hydratase